MSTYAAIALGVMLALTPSMIVIAIALWRAPTLREDEETPQ